jgi:hypothetical protein
MSQYDWTFSNGSASNVTLTSASAIGAQANLTYNKNALQAITYLDLTIAPLTVLSSYDDLAVLGGLQFLRLELSNNSSIEKLDFKSNTNLKYLEIKDVGFLEELDVSSNSNLQTIEIEGATTSHFRKMHLNNNCQLKSLNLTRALSLDSATTFDIELYGGGQLEDITIVGGALDKLDLTRNKNLKNLILTELPNLHMIDVSCAGSKLQSLFVGHSAVHEVRMGLNTHVGALSLVNTKVSSAIDLSACTRMTSLSYRNCNFSGSDGADFGGASGHMPNTLVDLDVTNTGITDLRLNSTNLETVIAGENETLTKVTLPHNNLGIIKNFDIHGANHPLKSAGFSGSDSIEMLNVQGCRITSSIYWPTNSIQIMMNDNRFTSSAGGGRNDGNFIGLGSLGHLEIERCNIDRLRLTDASNASRIKHVFASENRLAAFPTAAVVYDGTTIVGPYLADIGAPFGPESFNTHLQSTDYLQVLDLSDQNAIVGGFTYLDLQKNRNLRVLNVSGNTGLKAIRFVSHSVLMTGNQSPAIPGAAATLTVDLTGCSAFAYFIVESAESSESLHYMDVNGFITPDSVAGGWSIINAIGGL